MSVCEVCAKTLDEKRITITRTKAVKSFLTMIDLLLNLIIYFLIFLIFFFKIPLKTYRAK
ncbi:MAG TPA: hypothetical protein DC017_12870 [Candidatus Wallbacteria bacterium]|nr:hypothetical protein [Candidatus Wallbacteria bacterium]